MTRHTDAPMRKNDNVYALGVSMMRFCKMIALSVKDIAKQTVTEVLPDAGCTRDDIDVVYYAAATQGALDGQHMVRGQIALRPIGLRVYRS